MTVNYTIEAKPTTYSGVNFRSRLEARWAALLDMMKGTKWIYEPVDFGGWSPDFLWQLTDTYSIYIEVKPIILFDQDTADKMAKSPGGAVALFGLDPHHCWLNERGWWEDFTVFNVTDPNNRFWNEAGNLTQWKYAA